MRPNDFDCLIQLADGLLVASIQGERDAVAKVIPFSHALTRVPTRMRLNADEASARSQPTP
jgi:hypothetical protein